MAENKENIKEKPEKNWLTALLLCWFLGFFGVHRLYAGRVAEGLIMLYCTIVAALITYLNVYMGLACFVMVGSVVVYDFIIIAMKKFKDCYGREITSERV